MTTLPPVDLEARFLALGSPRSPAEHAIFQRIRQCLASRTWSQEQTEAPEAPEAARHNVTFTTASVLAYLTAVEAYREKPVEVRALRQLPADHNEREARLTRLVLGDVGISIDLDVIMTWSEQERREARHYAARVRQGMSVPEVPAVLQAMEVIG